MKVKILLIAAILLSGTIGVRAQDQVEAHLGADIVSDFYYKSDNTAHSFEGFINYDFGPVSASWQTYFAGSDYQVVANPASLHFREPGTV